MATQGNIRYNSAGYWEFSNDLSVYTQFATKIHTHSGADIADATPLAAVNSLVRRGPNAEVSFGSVNIGTSATVLTSQSLTLGQTLNSGILDTIQTSIPNIVVRGSSSNFKINVQDSGGRVNLLWNADQSLNGKYLVASEGAIRLTLTTSGTSASLGMFVAPPGTAAGVIAWTRQFGTDDTGNFYIGTSDAPGIILRPTGTAAFNGAILAQSFNTKSLLALKENVELFTPSAVEILNSLNVYEYQYKEDSSKTKKIGIIADYVESELISGKEHDRADLANLIGLLIKAVQELSRK